METRDHIFKSLEHLYFNDYQKNPQFIHDNWCLIVRMIFKLHRWLDYFAGKPGYTDFDVIYHKEQRHYCEGIQQALCKFTADFGEEFREIILDEVGIHIADDFCGDIPSKDQCTHSYIRRKQRELARGYAGD